MVSCRWLCAAMVIATLVPSASSAFVDPPVLVPEHPVDGETVSISIRAGVCDGFIEKPGYPQVTRNGSSIRVLLASTHSSGGTWCNLPTGEYEFVVGTFNPGNYVLQVDRFYQDIVGGTVIETLGVLSFSVTGTGTSATPVPLLGPIGIGVLLLGVLSLVAVFIESPGTAE